MIEAEKILKLHNQLLEQIQYLFPENGKVNVSTNQGVYIVYNKKGKVLHVGKTNTAKNGLNQRLLNHLTNHSSFSKGYLKSKGINLRKGGTFRFIEVENSRIRTLLEALTIGMLCPLHLGTGVKT